MVAKISVVVPVFDPGRDIDRCIDSVLGQSMPVEDYEVIFVDDGSTDGTAARLDALADSHAQVKVIHIENSGWPGRPRNLGIDAAQGVFIQFLDQDDHLGPEALERLYAMGERNHSDIVIGKVTSDFRAVPFELFRRDRDQCSINDAPLVSSMTAHKTFRRAFLVDHGVRFPEGRFIFEDHLFMVRAYRRAKRISVLASYPGYFYCERRDGTNTMSASMPPAEYYAQMGKVLAEAMSEATPVEISEQFVRRYQREMLGRLGDWFHRQEPTLQDQAFAAIQLLDRQVFIEREPTSLPVAHRMRSDLLRSGDIVAVREFAARTAGLICAFRLVDARWEAGRLRLTVTGRFAHGQDGPPLVLHRHDGRDELDHGLTQGILPDGLDVAGHLASFKSRASVWNLTTSIEWSVATRSAVRFEELRRRDDGSVDVVPTFDLVILVDPSVAAAGHPLEPGRWVVRIRASGLGLDRLVEIEPPDPGRLEQAGLGLFADPLRGLRPIAANALILDVRDVGAPRTALTSGPSTLDPTGRRTISVRLPVAASGSARLPALHLVLQGEGMARTMPAQLDSSGDRLRAVATPGLIRHRLPRGSYTVTLRIDDDGPDRPIGVIDRHWSGRTFARGSRRPSLMETGRETTRDIGRATLARLPSRVTGYLRDRVRRRRSGRSTR